MRYLRQDKLTLLLESTSGSENAPVGIKWKSESPTIFYKVNIEIIIVEHDRRHAGTILILELKINRYPCNLPGFISVPRILSVRILSVC